MEYVALGRSNLLVSRTSFGAMSLDCREIEAFGEEAAEKAACLVHQAYDGGVNFFDTAHSKPVSEKRLGSALHGIRQNVILATKTDARDVETLRRQLAESLDALATDTIDLFQIENPEIIPQKDGANGIYNALCELKSAGMIKHFGIATDNIEIARGAVISDLYETIQFPFNLLSGDEVIDLVKMCSERDVGFIAMQPLCGGIISNIPLAFGFLHQYENAVPVWGVRTQEELHQILYFCAHPPIVDEQFKEEAQKTREFFN
jgi:aryl-alcohol dehydrogenase-like predicted oxidoreductase